MISSRPCTSLQMVVYMQQQQQHGAEGVEAQDDLSAFIRSTVTIHSLITDRIDKLQPSQQLTLKVLHPLRHACHQITSRSCVEGQQPDLCLSVGSRYGSACDTYACLPALIP